MIDDSLGQVNSVVAELLQYDFLYAFPAMHLLCFSNKRLLDKSADRAVLPVSPCHPLSISLSARQPDPQIEFAQKKAAQFVKIYVFFFFSSQRPPWNRKASDGYVRVCSQKQECLQVI